MIMATHADAETLAFAQREDVGTLSQQGPVTPDHIIRTKRVPMLGTDVDAYTRDYKAYFDEHAPHAKEPKTMLDPAPRMVLDPAVRPGCGRQDGKGRGHSRRVVPAQHAGDAARAGPRRLPRPAPARIVRGRILGSGAGQAAKRRHAAAVYRRGRPGHGCGFGHRQSLRRSAARPRRRGGRTGYQSRDREPSTSARISSGCAAI